MSPTTEPNLRLRYAALSDVGRVRKDNQDSGYAGENLLVIADGVGGAARGDIASSTAVQILRRLDTPPPENLLQALAGAIHRAHDRIAELVDEDPELEGTSTTVTVALFDGRRVGIGHVGDSRGYLLRNGELSQLTKDHTFVQSLIDEGRITEEESRSHPHRNLILRAVDGVHETDPDLFTIELVPGDRLLLCSDGCSGVLDNDRLADILGTGTVDYSVVELIRASLEAGSSDNVTCVVADVVAADEPVDSDTVAAASTGPMLVGAAAEQPRRAGATSKSFFRGHRGGDTGELEPVPGEEETPVDPEELRYAPRPPRRFAWLRRIAILLGSRRRAGARRHRGVLLDPEAVLRRGRRPEGRHLPRCRRRPPRHAALQAVPDLRDHPGRAARVPGRPGARRDQRRRPRRREEDRREHRRPGPAVPHP